MHVLHAKRTHINHIVKFQKNNKPNSQGLRVNDQILDFGSVNGENFNDLTDIANVVRHSVNELIKVVVRRGDSVVKLYLKPRTWAGSGFLGCVILPIEDVER